MLKSLCFVRDLTGDCESLAKIAKQLSTSQSTFPASLRPKALSSAGFYPLSQILAGEDVPANAMKNVVQPPSSAATRPNGGMRTFFGHFACKSCHVAGTPWAFLIALAAVVT